MKPAQRGNKDVLRQTKQMQEAYVFILAGHHNAASLAQKLGVSVPTASRVVEQLRQDLMRHKKRLVSVRSEEGFHYEVQDDARAHRIQHDPMVSLVIPARSARRTGLKAEDHDIYDWE
jgi:hypothetical protein